MALAHDETRAGRLDGADASATVDNPLCGDRVTLDVRLDGGTLALPPVFEKLARLDYQGAVIPEHFPDFPCAEGLSVSRAFALGYTRALIQAHRTPSSDQEGSHP